MSESVGYGRTTGRTWRSEGRYRLRGTTRHGKDPKVVTRRRREMAVRVDVGSPDSPSPPSPTFLLDPKLDCIFKFKSLRFVFVFSSFNKRRKWFVFTYNSKELISNGSKSRFFLRKV